MIEFDVETTGLQWYWDEMFLAQFYEPEGRHTDDDNLLEVLRWPEDREAIQWWLDRDDDFRAWNSKFDFHFADHAGLRLPPQDRWFDGMVDAHICDERFSAALQNRGDKLFGPEAAGRPLETAVKTWLAEETNTRRRGVKAAQYEWLEAQGHPQKRNRLPQVPPGLSLPPELKFVAPDYSDVPWHLINPYASHDVTLQRQVGDVYDPQIAANADLSRVYELERGVLGALFALEQRGLPFDGEAAKSLLLATDGRLNQIEQECKAIAGKSSFNPASPDQVGETLKRLGADLRFAGTTPGGKPQMNEEGLSTVEHPLAAKVLEYRSAQKLFGTYLMPILKGDENRKPFMAPHDGRIHSNMRQVGTKTGRMSSSDPNVQNWHRDDLSMRDLVRAEPGKVLVAADMDAIEARVMAYYTVAVGGGRLLDTLRSGGDLHTLTAEMVGLTGRQRASGFESARQQGKRLNYLKGYQGGVRAIRKFFLVSQAEAGNINDRFNETYPELRQLSDMIQWRLSEKRYVKTFSGRRIRLERSLREEGYKFMSYVNQGTAADLFKMATVRLHQQGVPLVAAVHDELVAEVDEADAPEVAVMMQEALTDFPEIQEHVPLFAEAKTVKRWSHAKDPDYKPSYERN